SSMLYIILYIGIY
ncbi:ATP-dependent DNA helicase pif1, partial [Araneus ventricosus]